IFMLVIFGGVFLRSNSTPPEFMRPLIASGGISMLFYTMSGLAGNQFGFDRSGFRVFVLSSATRRDILLGKNLALIPFVLGLASMVVVLLQVVYPMRIDHFLAVLLQMVPMYLVYSLVANLLSILAPMPIAPGSLRPSKPKGMTLLIHFAFMFLFPFA